MLGSALPWMRDIVRPRQRQSAPVVLFRAEVERLLATLTGAPALMARLPCGTGMRLMECVGLFWVFPARSLSTDPARGRAAPA